jgi:hypothetical protein
MAHNSITLGPLFSSAQPTFLASIRVDVAPRLETESILANFQLELQWATGSTRLSSNA